MRFWLATKRQKRRKECEGKVKYETGLEAQQAARNLAQDLVAQGQNGRNAAINFYSCGFGKHWHIGHRIGRRPSRHKVRRK